MDRAQADQDSRHPLGYRRRVVAGNVGRLALTQLITDPRFELAGVWVSADDKVGKDAGELAQIDVSTGIAATGDLAALLATDAECAVYCALGDTRLREAMEDCRRILAAGINVVGSSPGVLQYPWGMLPDKYLARLEEAAQQGNSSLFVNGIDPGDPAVGSRLGHHPRRHSRGLRTGTRTRGLRHSGGTHPQERACRTAIRDPYARRRFPATDRRVRARALGR